jgi:hypothetical protein
MFHPSTQQDVAEAYHGISEVPLGEWGEDGEFGEAEFGEDDPYGWWWATKAGKARRRDRKARRAARREAKAEKAAAKGKTKKAQKLRKKARKSRERSEALEDKLKGTIHARGKKKPKKKSKGRAEEGEYVEEEVLMDEDYIDPAGAAFDEDLATIEAPSIATPLLAIGGVAVVGTVAYFLLRK